MTGTIRRIRAALSDRALTCGNGRPRERGGGSPRAFWGLAFGLTRAVRAAGPAEAPALNGGSRGCFPRSGWERIFGCPCGWRGRPGQCAAFRPGAGDLRLAIGALGAGTATPETLISAIQRREQRLRTSWQDDGADAKPLRTAFRRYRAFFDQLTLV